MDTGSESGRIGRYQIVERLAIGGMAEVLLALDELGSGGQRLVVIKRLLPHLADDSSFVKMFIQEARIAAGISHPNVVRIHKLGEEGGFPYIVMEHVPGSTFRQLQKVVNANHFEVPIGVALHLGIQACAGAHAAHEYVNPWGSRQEVVHRDLSPHNLMVTNEGLVKVLDFGIAKATTGMDNTRTGVLKGKLGYFSPEQCLQKDVDRRSDIFTLTTVIWELIAGCKLFAGESELEIMQAIASCTIQPLQDIRPEVPDALVKVLEHALEASPGDRYDTAAELAQAIKHAAHEDEIQISQYQTASFIQGMLGERHAKLAQSVKESVTTHTDTRSRGTFPTFNFQGDDSESESPKTAPTRVRASQVSLVARSNSSSPKSLTQTDSSRLEYRNLVAREPSSHISLPTSTKERPWPSELLAVVFGTLVLALIFLGWMKITTQGEQSAGTLNAQGASSTAIQLLFPPTLDPHQLTTEMDPLRKYLSKQLEQQVSFTVTANYEETTQQLLNGSVHYALMPPLLFVQARQQEPGIQPLAVQVVDGKLQEKGIVLVNARVEASSASDLVGLRICYTDPQSASSFLLMRDWLQHGGLNPDNGFSRTLFSGNHLQLIRDLAQGACDVGGTYSGAYVAASSVNIPTAELRQIAVTGDVPSHVVVAGPKADPALTQKLQDALVALIPEEVTGQRSIGSVRRLTGFAHYNAAAYASLEASAKEAMP